MQDAVIVSATRTAVGKAPAGSLRTVRPDDMAAAVIKESLRRAPGVDAKDFPSSASLEIEDRTALVPQSLQRVNFHDRDPGRIVPATDNGGVTSRR